MARSVRELASSFPCRFGYSPQSSPHFPPFARTRNESTLIVRNYAQERRDPREKFHASCLYRYLARFRCSYRSSCSHQPVADAAIVSHRSCSSHQPVADAANCHGRSHQPAADAANRRGRSHQPATNAANRRGRSHQPAADAANRRGRSHQPAADAAGAFGVVDSAVLFVFGH